MDNSETRGTPVPRKQKKKKSAARRIVGITLLLLFLYLVYFVVGMCVPFLPLESTAPGARDPASYRGDGTPWVERASVIEENSDALDWRLRLIDAATDSNAVVLFLAKTEQYDLAYEKLAEHVAQEEEE